MKTTAMMKKNAPRFVDDIHVLVTKEFAKNARIFGTPEYKVWKEIRLDCPTAEMVTKTIRKNPDKKTSTKNMTYENMAIYIQEQNNAAICSDSHKRRCNRSLIKFINSIFTSRATQTIQNIAFFQFCSTHRKIFFSCYLIAVDIINCAVYITCINKGDSFFNHF